MLLPHPFTSARAYATALGSFVTSTLFRTLTVCTETAPPGWPVTEPTSARLIQVEIHHLDLFTSLDPWSRLPGDWQVWFDASKDEDELERKLKDVTTPLDRTSDLSLEQLVPVLTTELDAQYPVDQSL
jgi:hypothetical protein